MTAQVLFWEKGSSDHVQCQLCPHRCRIAKGHVGKCGVRRNEHGTLHSLIYGKCSGVSADPIEKKPLHHFYPGSLVFSLGSVGCNLSCDHCQNYHISTAKPDGYRFSEISPEDAVDLAQQHGCKGIAFTYNEPTIWFEYTYDTAQRAKKAGLYTVYVTNGFITADPVQKIAPLLDAMNIDVKAFTNTFYKKTCQASLQPVLDTCKLAHELGIHIELTYLVIPGKNDSMDEIRRFCSWVLETVGEEVPIYFSRFHPHYKMTDKQATPLSTLTQSFDMAKSMGIQYVYLGNVADPEYENTFCPSCGEVLIERTGFTARLSGLSQGKCMTCGKVIPIITENNAR